MAIYRFRSGGRVRRVFVGGRDEWALRQLMKAGTRGCTPLKSPALRWAAYVHNLRNKGIPIETLPERHDGPFPGHHARYVLRADVQQETRRAS